VLNVSGKINAVSMCDQEGLSTAGFLRTKAERAEEMARSRRTSMLSSPAPFPMSNTHSAERKSQAGEVLPGIVLSCAPSRAI